MHTHTCTYTKANSNHFKTLKSEEKDFKCPFCHTRTWLSAICVLDCIVFWLKRKKDPVCKKTCQNLSPYYFHFKQWWQYFVVLIIRNLNQYADLDRCAKEGCLYQPAFIWLGFNLGITLLGTLLVIYVQVRKLTVDKMVLKAMEE